MALCISLTAVLTVSVCYSIVDYLSWATIFTMSDHHDIKCKRYTYQIRRQYSTTQNTADPLSARARIDCESRHNRCITRLRCPLLDVFTGRAPSPDCLIFVRATHSRVISGVVTFSGRTPPDKIHRLNSGPASCDAGPELSRCIFRRRGI